MDPIINKEYIPSIDEKNYPPIIKAIKNYHHHIMSDVSFLNVQKPFVSSLSKKQIYNNINTFTDREIPHNIKLKKQLYKKSIKKKEQPIKLPMILSKDSSMRQFSPFSSEKKSLNFSLTDDIEIKEKEQENKKNSIMFYDPFNSKGNKVNKIKPIRHFRKQSKLEQQLDLINNSLNNSYQNLMCDSENFSQYNNDMMKKCNRYLNRFDNKVNIQSDEFLKIPIEKSKYNINTALDKMIERIKNVNVISAEMMLRYLAKKNTQRDLREIKYYKQAKKHERVMSILENSDISSKKIKSRSVEKKE